jgi:hypothetical protein
MTIREVIRRLAVVEATIRPANSLGARLKRITPEQRITYDQWRELRDRWAGRFDEADGMYRTILDGNDGPQLSASIAAVLFDPPPQILATDTDAQAGEKWTRYLER